MGGAYIHKKNPCWYGARVYDKLGNIVETVSTRLGKNYKNSNLTVI